MSATVADLPRRPTKAERGAATRTRLLDATVDCLVHLGWAGTSTTEVVKRAGVSRGAQVHHYPTKEDLVLAAVDHVLQRRVAEYRAAFARLPATDRTRGTAFDLLWESGFGDTFAAWLELAVAARTAPALRARFFELEARFRATTLDEFQRMFPETEADPAPARVGLLFAFSVLDGMAIGRLTGKDEATLDEVREIFKLIIAPYFPATEGGAA